MKRKRLNVELPLKEFDTLKKIAEAEDKSLVGMIIDAVRYYSRHNPVEFKKHAKKAFRWKTFDSTEPTMSTNIDQHLYGK